MSIIHQITARLQEFTVEALTKEQFDKWDSAKKRQYLKDHPHSKFGKGNTRRVQKNTRDANTARIRRSVPKGKSANDIHVGKSQYHFTDTNGKTHTYTNRKQVERHRNKLAEGVQNADRARKAAKTPAAKKRYDALYESRRDHHDALDKLLRNRTFNKEHPKG